MLEMFLAKIAAASKVSTVVTVCTDIVFSLGATRCSYHLIPPFGNPLGEDVRMIQRGYPREWIERFEDVTFRANDPIIGWIIQRGRTGTWKRVLAERSLTSAQQDFVAFSNSYGLNDGVGIPLFGPNGNDGYVSICLSDRDISERDEALLLEFTTIWQSGHQRIFRLTEHLQTGAKLSARETEVLGWMSKSKSNTDIAAILGLSPATVDTIVRRIFAKLGVHDRLAAVVCGLKNGLVKF